MFREQVRPVEDLLAGLKSLHIEGKPYPKLASQVESVTRSEMYLTHAGLGTRRGITFEFIFNAEHDTYSLVSELFTSGNRISLSEQLYGTIERKAISEFCYEWRPFVAVSFVLYIEGFY